MTAPTSAPSVLLPAHLAEAIIAHAREGKPEEICGVVRGRGLHAYEVVRGENIADERIENYTVDPQTLLRQFEFEDAGDEMMGIYHSHPVSVAYPSATDAWNAHYPDSIYFICSLEYDDAPVIRAYGLITHFLAEDALHEVRNLRLYETRPGLFAHYQPAHAPLPPGLAAIAGEATAPFYLVFSVPADATYVSEIRAVSIVEHPVVEG